MGVIYFLVSKLDLEVSIFPVIHKHTASNSPCGTEAWPSEFFILSEPPTGF